MRAVADHLAARRREGRVELPSSRESDSSTRSRLAGRNLPSARFALGQGDLSGVTLDLTAFDRASGHFAALGSDRDGCLRRSFRAGRKRNSRSRSIRRLRDLVGDLAPGSPSWLLRNLEEPHPRQEQPEAQRGPGGLQSDRRASRTRQPTQALILDMILLKPSEYLTPITKPPL